MPSLIAYLLLFVSGIVFGISRGQTGNLSALAAIIFCSGVALALWDGIENR